MSRPLAAPSEAARSLHSSDPHWFLECLGTLARIHPGRSALLSVDDSPPLTFLGLLAEVRRQEKRLRELGVAEDTRVGLLLPSSPGALVTFLATAGITTAVPIHQGLEEADFEALTEPLKLDTWVATQDQLQRRRRPATVATILSLPRDERGTGSSDFQPCATREIASRRNPRSSAEGSPPHLRIVTVLSTSGTTARPKLLEMTQEQFAAYVQFQARWQQLSSDDRVLNFMPWYHLHGLLRTGLAPLLSGCAVICAGRLDSDRALPWIERLEPTWFSAVPAMHRSILRAAELQGRSTLRSKLRFVMSASDFLPERLALQMESFYGVPVIELYGMTEVFPGTSCTGVANDVRRQGTVGRPVIDVAILDPSRSELAPSRIGEIAVDRAQVLAPMGETQSTDHELSGRWFCTGDEGFLDEHGFLHLTGRIKDQINFAGEKISPFEIEQVLEDHPDVDTAICGGATDPRGQPWIVACVVARPGRDLDREELRRFVGQRLAPYKIPQRIELVQEIPAALLGKPRRWQLGVLLRERGVESSGACMTPRGETIVAPSTPEIAQGESPREELLAMARTLLGVKGLDTGTDLFDSGATSFSITALLERVESRFGARLSFATVLENPTVERLARVVSELASPRRSALVHLSPEGSRPPLFCVSGIAGDALRLRPLARALSSESRGFVAIVPPWRERGALEFRPIEQLASLYLEEIAGSLDGGCCQLGGYSFGCYIAVEMARILESRGLDVRLFLLDPGVPGQEPHRSEADEAQKIPPRVRRLLKLHREAKDSLEILPLKVRVLLLQSSTFALDPRNYEFWRTRLLGLERHLVVDGSHTRILKHPAVQLVAREVGGFLDESPRADPTAAQ